VATCRHTLKAGELQRGYTTRTSTCAHTRLLPRLHRLTGLPFWAPPSRDTFTLTLPPRNDAVGLAAAACAVGRAACVAAASIVHTHGLDGGRHGGPTSMLASMEICFPVACRRGCRPSTRPRRWRRAWATCAAGAYHELPKPTAVTSKPKPTEESIWHLPGHLLWSTHHDTRCLAVRKRVQFTIDCPQQADSQARGRAR
jgi:hypothetical protein